MASRQGYPRPAKVERNSRMVCQLAAAYPELAGRMSVSLPDEAFRRVGQSVAAASLPAGK